ncbi:hypothetical protein [Novosphingopyxis sp. YJ-S2-01]|uniref:hypothetical protein n=1 Tax=Novosphingopyxis sp. YJ-S2-01 TaxID=2794021 RepID=UPI0018DCFC01|nr:hypothetical protein [Novosphingopyxis sp. YJ-S2-01]MBH9538103.1 hypothetical protein [Novosphingopyxis sp. YJ-S2-01]
MANDRVPSITPLQEAERIDREQPALLADLGARLFPRSQIVLDEATIASARAILFTLVGRIEAELIGQERNIAWPVIERSGLPQDSALLAFLLAHASWLRLVQRVGGGAAQRSNIWLAGLAAEDDGMLGRSALDLLSARSRPAPERLSGYRDLPAPLFRQLVKQVDAALTLESGSAKPSNAADLIAGYNEADGLPYLAVRLAGQLASAGNTSELRQPEKAGMDLFAGWLATELDAGWYDVVRILGEGGVRLMLLLRAAGFGLDEAGALIDQLGDPDNARALRSYAEIDRQAARRVLFARNSAPEQAHA